MRGFYQRPWVAVGWWQFSIIEKNKGKANFTKNLLLNWGKKNNYEIWRSNFSGQ